MFSNLPSYPGDPIFALVEQYKKDPRPDKVNLSVGVYCDDRGSIPMLECVKEAERRYLADRAALGYLPIEGDPVYREAVGKLLFGAGSAALDTTSIVQTVGGSGALRVGADFVRKFFPGSRVWISDPTWDNHLGIFGGAGLEVLRYAYYDPRTKGLATEEMLEALGCARAHDLLVLVPCCHNPTGVDPTRAEWDRLLDLIEHRGMIPFVDLAYQGFGEDLDTDTWLLKELVSRGIAFLLSNSFSKNFSLYGERCGALAVYCHGASDAHDVQGQLQLCIRQNYSTPPTHGMALIKRILTDPELTDQWHIELAAMRDRVRTMRVRLQEALQERVPHVDTTFLLRQRGMFAYTGLTPEQVDTLREQHGLYVLKSGRICIAGLNSNNIAHAARAFAQVLQSSTT
jgi:aromatic-amino-acid transaminase